MNRRIATLHSGRDGVLVGGCAGDEVAAELGEHAPLFGASDQRPHLVAPLAQGAATTWLPMNRVAPVMKTLIRAEAYPEPPTLGLV